MKTALRFALALIIAFSTLAALPARSQADAAVPDAKTADRIQAPAPVPANLSPEIAGVAKMVEGGVDPSVIQAYIEHTKVAFRPTADEILYLHRLGASSEIITALLKKGGVETERDAEEDAAGETERSTREATGQAGRSRTIYTYVYPPFSVPWFSYPTTIYPSYRYQYSYRYPAFRYRYPSYRYYYNYAFPFCF